MEILTDKELDFLKEEAKKIKAIDHLKEIAKKHDLLFPDSNKPEEKKRLLEDHNRRKKATNKALKLVSRVDIDIVEEGIYEPKDQTLKKEYCVLTKIICKSSDPEDQVFTEVTLGGGINFFLGYTIDKVLQERLDNYRITEAENRKKAKFKKPGHLVDQILKVAPRESTTLDLFSELSEETRTELKKEKVEISRELFSGINLTASEMKIQDTFSILLSQQSQTEDAEKPNYYTGAKPETVPSFLGGKGAIAPSIEFSLYTIAKEFKGGKTPTGKDLQNVKKILQELEKKKFLIRHTEIYSKRGGGKTTLEREGYRALFHLDKVTLTEEDKNGKQTNKAETMVVVLSPLYRQQIESKFILQPLDIIQQLTQANGSPNIPLATYKLKEYLFRELSSKHYECKITARKLYETLEPKLMQVPKIKDAKENTNRAINTLLSLGLLERYETGTSKVGEAMFTFYLNKNY
jgi:hypothetical protein